jgi:N-acetylmuramoyl-L-alanine amidase
MTKTPVSRRLLLGHGVAATLLLPASSQAAAVITPGVHRTPAPPAGRPSRPPPVVMLDPGHGGKDPGAIGVSGTYEKNIALATAFELKRQLEAGGRYQVVLTRIGDRFIPLEDRVGLAEKARAALFVSMHADAFTDHSIRGASVYTLSNGASDPVAAALARRENSSDRFAGPGFHGVPPAVAQILASLVKEETRRDSARMAHSVVGAFDQDINLLPNPARHAGFIVLKAADIPSVLVEMGFMSNPQDEAALRRPAHRTKVAEAMKRAVDLYFAAASRGPAVAG